jgi:hypothetical protein
MATPPEPPPPAGDTELVEFTIDLTAHELARRGHVLAAIPDWDPIAVLAGEQRAWALLMSNLDPEQQAVHRMLVEAGVLDA